MTKATKTPKDLKDEELKDVQGGWSWGANNIGVRANKPEPQTKSNILVNNENITE